MAQIKKPKDKPKKEDKQALKAWLKSKGGDAAQVEALFSDDNPNITYEDITQRIIAWQRTLPKAS